MSISACGCLQAWFQLQDTLFLTFIFQASISTWWDWISWYAYSLHDTLCSLYYRSRLLEPWCYCDYGNPFNIQFCGSCIHWVSLYYVSSVAHADCNKRYMSDRIGRLNTHLLCLFVSALSCLLLWMFAHTYGMIMAFAVMFGFVGSSYYTVCK